MAPIVVRSEIITCSRLHRKEQGDVSPSLMQSIGSFLNSVNLYSGHIAFAVDTTDQLLHGIVVDILKQLSAELKFSLVSVSGDCFTTLQQPNSTPDFIVYIVGITKWVGFVEPLNLLVQVAHHLRCPFIMFQSLEVFLSHEGFLSGLWMNMQLDTLVVGVRLEGHFFVAGAKNMPLNGVTSPWNTCALWRVSRLMKTTFHPVSDGIPVDSDSNRTQHAGVEEVVAVSLLQMKHPAQCVAKLVDIVDSGDVFLDMSDIFQKSMPEEYFEVMFGQRITTTPARRRSSNALCAGDDSISDLITQNMASKTHNMFPLQNSRKHVKWDTDFSGDYQRAYWHSTKMNSKYIRANHQIKFLGIPPGVVEHILVTL